MERQSKILKKEGTSSPQFQVISSSTLASDPEEGLIQWRLLVKEFSVKNISKSFFDLETAFYQLLSQKTSLKEDPSLDPLFEQLSKDLSYYDLNTLLKLQIKWTANQNQIQNYKDTYIQRGFHFNLFLII